MTTKHALDHLVLEAAKSTPCKACREAEMVLETELAELREHLEDCRDENAALQSQIAALKAVERSRDLIDGRVFDEGVAREELILRLQSQTQISELKGELKAQEPSPAHGSDQKTSPVE